MRNREGTQSWGRENQTEKGVVQGIHLSDYGKENRFRIDVGEAVDAQIVEVLVDGEHTDKNQRMPVERVYHDTSSKGAEPLAVSKWDYAEMPDGKVELQHVRTTSRDGDRELVQDINRIFRNDGSVDTEEVHVDGSIFKRRTHAPREGYDGEMVYDDFYDAKGDVERRVVFFKKQGAGEWAAYKSVYKDGQDRLEREEGSLAGPPVLEGIPQLNRLTESPKMEYISADKDEEIIFKEVA